MPNQLHHVGGSIISVSNRLGPFNPKIHKSPNEGRGNPRRFRLRVLPEAVVQNMSPEARALYEANLLLGRNGFTPNCKPCQPLNV